MKISFSIRHFILLGLSALLFAISFAPWNIWPAGFIALIPVFILLEEKIPNKRSAIFWGFILGLITDIFAYHWIIHTMTIFGHIPLPAAILLFIVYSFFANLRFGVFFLAVYFWQKYSEKIPSVINSRLILLPVFWYLTERFVWRLFPWHGGNLVSGDLLFLQSADLFGIYGISFFWFMINQFLYLASVYFLQSIKGKVSFYSSIDIHKKHLIPGGAVLVLLHLYGIFSLQYWDHRYENAPKKIIGITQGNTPLSFAKIKDMRSFLNNTTHKMVDQSIELYRDAKEKYSRLDLLLWPESSVPFLRYARSSFLQKEIKRMYEAIDSEFIFNDIYERYEKTGNRYRLKSYSNLWFFDREGNAVQNYQKNYPLPFGETIPLGNIFPIVYEIMPEVSDFAASNRVNLFQGETGFLLPSICYETILPVFTLDFYQRTQKKAQILINVTNDTWFGDSIETYEHTALAKVRSVEYRIPQLRAVNSGVSVFIDHSGRIHSPTPLFQRINRIYEVGVLSGTSTFFSKVGNLPLNIYSLAVFFLWLFGLIRSKRIV